jgi:hypothetical protein
MPLTPEKSYTKLLTVNVGGADLTKYVDAVSSHLGFDVQVPTCQIKFITDPGVSAWDEVTFDAGRSPAAPAGSKRRFTGWLAPNKTGTGWRNGLTLMCSGHLRKAQIVEAPNDEDAETEGLPPAPHILAEGTDLSIDPVTLLPWSDADMVLWVLAACGLDEWIGGIDGTGRLLGTEVPEQFIWRRGQSALDFINQLDATCLGFRTYEDQDGYIWRKQILPNVPFVQPGVIDLYEALHILPGLEVKRLTDHLANKVIVQGFDDGSGALRHYLNVAADEIPAGVPTRTATLASPMIESELESEGIGLSCEAVATWQADEVSQVKLEATVPTWRDDLFVPGATGYLNIVRPFFVQQSLWIRSIETSVARKQLFKQTVGLYGALYVAGRAPRLGTMALPNPLNGRLA